MELVRSCTCLRIQKSIAIGIFKCIKYRNYVFLVTIKHPSFLITKSCEKHVQAELVEAQGFLDFHACGISSKDRGFSLCSSFSEAAVAIECALDRFRTIVLKLV